MAARVLIADDDETTRVIFQKALNNEGFEVFQAATGTEAEARLLTSIPDVLVLNSRLPGTSGLELCRRLRLSVTTMRVPIILLVSHENDSDRLKGLSAGADDCLMTPFPAVEIAIRVKNLLRRTNPALLEHMLKVGDLTLDRESRRVHRQKREVRLGPTEFKLLEFLMRTPGKVYSRAELRTSLWGDDATVDERAVDLHIGRLRKGISLGKSDNVIRTVRGAGYALGDF